MILCFLKNINKTRIGKLKYKENKSKLNINASGPEVIYSVTQLYFLAVWSSGCYLTENESKGP